MWGKRFHWHAISFDRAMLYPEGRHEAAADIATDDWINLRVSIKEFTLDAFVDSRQVISLAKAKAPARHGQVGLFVDIYMEAYSPTFKSWPHDGNVSERNPQISNFQAQNLDFNLLLVVLLRAVS